MSLAGDEHLYAQIAEEMESGNLDKGIWTKALAQNEFDDAKAKADYVEVRVAQLKEALAVQAEEEATRAAEERAETERSREEAVKAAAADAIQNYRKKVHQRGDVWIWAAGVILVAMWFFWSNC